MSPISKCLLAADEVDMVVLQLCSTAGLDEPMFSLRPYTEENESSDSAQWLLYDLGDGAVVKDRGGLVAIMCCAKTKKQEIVDKLLVLCHADGWGPIGTTQGPWRAGRAGTVIGFDHALV